ncbi:mechanosensitive ion channel family protein [Dysgonomonas sp. GY617]|uniref:mechanosensitive ion channel family protein n=1 Tax=Dysgonomonas sp. GY617 TaxID=2780420 RepID=UPI0018847A39|nr:mechanosensitive ion channel domain-containing protein [Dysgonomonas sp. GY617]MBF0574802.1 mechanosensitive ion channel [Dysgonomonas sp. GY617]
MDNIVEDSDIKTSANFVTDLIHDLLEKTGISERWIDILNLIIMLVAAIIIVYVLQKVVRIGLTYVFKKIEKVTSLSIFKHAEKNRLPHFLALVIPYTFIINTIPIIFANYPTLIKPTLKIAEIYMVFMVIWTIMSIIKSMANVLQEKPAFHNKPMKSYLQVIQIIFYIFGAVAIYSILTGKSATAFFTAMGAASAVLMLMFKDTIMGFVSSIQISTNQMVMIGDWITMNKYGADGDVMEINLTTVKVRNFDKTITTIPTYALISDSFQNWRGMQDSGGRRIKRAFTIKQTDIKPLTDKELDEFEKVIPLSSYIKSKRKQYANQNEALKIDSSSIIKGFQITNCDLFMRYATWYLRNNPEIHQEMTLIVRQLAPSTQGLPIEVYAFTNTTAWSEYERIMSEVFNHLISSVSIFGLTVFEVTAGTDGYDVKIEQSPKDNKITN